MIKTVLIKGYRRFREFQLAPSRGLNIIAGDNESGKSTLLEAIALALTFRVNGRWAKEELNPYWFNAYGVKAFFEARARGDNIEPPSITIELYLDGDGDVHRLRGVHNSKSEDCPGLKVLVEPSADYSAELAEYLRNDPPEIVPVEFYDAHWRSFADEPLERRPKAVKTSFIDSRTVRSTSGIDHHTREILSSYLDDKERAQISLAHRKARYEVTRDALSSINERLSESEIHDRPVGIQMDQSSRASWDADVVPQVDEIPFAMAGQGQQAMIKISLAMAQTAASSNFVLLEEPENHLSHTSLSRLLSRIERSTAPEQQFFVTTHSSFVLNRLGLDRLILLRGDRSARITGLSGDTVNYFRKLSGYDTLRLVLARKLALVEGPSDDIVLSRAFKDKEGKLPPEAGIDVVSMRGLSFKRALELCSSLARDCVAIRDNDGADASAVQAEYAEYLEDGKCKMIVSAEPKGRTLEPQIVGCNDEHLLRRVLKRTDRADLATWMTNNKTEAAILIYDSDERIIMPDYIDEAIELLR